MLIQLNTDNHVEGRAKLAHYVEGELTKALGRFGTHVTRVEVHFQDVNGDKAGADDKRCMLEARLSGHDPLVVSHAAETLHTAFAGAREKLVRTVDRKLAKLRPPKGRDPFEAIVPRAEVF